MILINITKVHCQTVSNRSDFSPTMLALVKDGVVHFIPLQAVHFKLIRTVQIIMIYPVHLKVIRTGHLNRCNQTISQQLQKELPGLRGFSVTNIKNMRSFYEEWSPVINSQPMADENQTLTEVSDSELDEQMLHTYNCMISVIMSMNPQPES